METNNIIQPQKSKVLMIILIIIIVLGLGVGGYYVYKSQSKKSTPSTSSSSQQVASTDELSEELKSINVDELKQAVNELKDTISSFSK